ncbi:MAG: hypothetical protein R2742_06320 [Micropruina glycogenica]
MVLFIDEIHTLVGAGAAEEPSTPRRSESDARSWRAQTIGATTLDEYRKYLHREGRRALERRFQPIQVAEPSIALTIPKHSAGPARPLPSHHRITITDAAHRGRLWPTRPSLTGSCR